MNTERTDAPIAPAAPKFSVWLCIAGGLFMILWISAFVMLGTAMMVATIMANASGAASNTVHMLFIAGVFFGNVIAGAAGISGGLAFFWRGRRRLLVWISVGLVLLGILLVAAGFGAFFSSAS